MYVTGAAGFLGTWLCDALLRQGAQVVGLTYIDPPSGRWGELRLAERMTVVQGDVADGRLNERILNQYRIDTVIHLAAQPIVTVANRAPADTFHANITGTWELLEACRRYGGCERIVVASTDKAYGESAVLPYHEDLPTVAVHPYDVSKSCTDLLARSFAHTFHMPITISRCGNFYGGGDLQWSRIVPDVCRALIEGRTPVIRSDGSPVRDYIHVQDVVSAYLLLADRAGDEDVRGQAFNFGTETPVSVLALVQKLVAVSGRTGVEPLVEGRAPNELQVQFLSIDKARRILGWQPQVPLDTGLQAAYDWYRQYLGHSTYPWSTP